MRLTVRAGRAPVVRTVVRGVVGRRTTLGVGVVVAEEAGAEAVGAGSIGEAVEPSGGGDVPGATSPMSSSVPRIVAVAWASRPALLRSGAHGEVIPIEKPAQTAAASSVEAPAMRRCAGDAVASS